MNNDFFIKNNNIQENSLIPFNSEHIESPIDLENEINVTKKTVKNLVQEINLFSKPPYPALLTIKIKELKSQKQILLSQFQKINQKKFEKEIDLKQIEKQLKEAEICLETHPILEMFPWLETGNEAPKVSDKTLVHVVGDEFAQAADLEGDDMRNPLNFALSCLKEKPEFIDKETWKNTLKLLEKCLEIKENITPCSDLKELTHKTRALKDLVKKTIDKKQSLLIPGGWIAKPSGHAMYYLLEPQINGKWSFKLFNRGAGVNHHASVVEHGPSVLFPAYKEIVDIDKKQLLNPIFLQSLIEFQVFDSHPQSNQETNYNDIDIYQKIIPLLKGKERSPVLAFEDLMSTHISGTCSWKSLTAVFQALFGAQNNKQMICRFEMQAVWSYYQANQNDLSSDPKKLNLLAQAIISVTHTLRSLYKARGLNEDEYLHHCHLLSEIEKKISFAETQALHLLLKNAPRLPTRTDELIIVKASPENVHINSNSLATTQINSQALVETPPLSQKIELIKKWQPSTETLLKDLQIFFKECQEANNRENYATTQFIFNELARRLPVPTHDSIFWQEIIQNSKPDCTELMNLICSLFEKFYESCFCTSENSILDRTFSAIKMLHLQNILISHTPLASIGPAEELYLEEIFSKGRVRPELTNLEYFRNTCFQTHNPQISQEIKQIYEDYKSKIANLPSSKVLAFHEHIWVFNYRLNGLEISESFFREKDLNPEFTYIKKLLKNPEFRKKIKEHYNNDPIPIFFTNSFDELDKGEQIVYIYIYGKDFLDKSFVNWRTQIIQSRTLIYNLVNEYPQQKITAEELTPTFQIDKQGKDSNWEGNIVVQIPSLTNLSHARDYTRFSFCYKELQRPINDSNIDIIIKEWQYNRDLTENDIYNQKLKLIPEQMTFPLSKVKEMLNLATNKNLQIEKTVAYFKKNLVNLADKNYQNLFHILLFDGDLLLQELKTNPQIIHTLNTLLRSGYQQAFDTADISTCVFYLSLSRTLQAYQEHVFSDEKEEKFLLYDEKMEQLFSLTSLTNEDKSLLYLDRIASYAKSTQLTTTQVALLIKGLTHLSINPLSSDTIFPFVETEKKYTLVKHLTSIENALKESGDEILNQAMAPHLIHFQKLKWKPDPFPLFCTEQEHKLNVLTGEFFNKDQSSKGMPNHIIENPNYKHLFKKPYPAETIGFNIYKFKDEHGNQYKIYKEGKKLIIQRNIEGNWFEYKKNGIKASLHRASKDNQKTIVSLMTEGFKADKNIWVSLDTPKQIVCFDSTQKKYHVELENFAKNNYNLKIFRHKDSSIKDDLLLQPFDEEGPFCFLKRFEDPDFINTWADEKGNVHVIDLNRFKLNFKLDKSDSKHLRWMCVQKKGFYLSSQQFVSPMGNLDQYLVLQNDNGEKHILVPLNDIEDTKDSAFSEKIILQKDVQEYATYILKENSRIDKSILKPKDAQASLHLAYLKLATGRYREARYFLGLAKMPLKGDLIKELTSLHRIINLKKSNQDGNIEASALRLHAAFLYLELLHRHYPMESNLPQKEIFIKYALAPDVWLKIKEDCENYASQVERIGSLRLPEREEKIVFQALFEESKGNVSYAVKWYMQTIGLKTKQSLFDWEIPLDTIPVKSYRTENYEQLKSYCEVLKISQKDNDIDYPWINFCNLFAKVKTEPENFPICWTRPMESGLQTLWALLIINPSDEKLKKQIQQCLNICTDDREDRSYLFRAILEMMLKHPGKYNITPPDFINLPIKKKHEDVFLKSSDKQAILKWVKNNNILKLLNDYLLENAGDAVASVIFPILTFKPLIRDELLSEKTNISRSSPSYIDTAPKSLGNFSSEKQSTLVKELAVPRLIKISKEIIEQKLKDDLDDLEKASTRIEGLFKDNKAQGRCMQNELARLKQDCQIFRKQSEEKSLEINTYTLPVESLPNLKVALNLKIQQLQQQLIENEEAILKIVHSRLVEGIESVQTEVPFLRKKREKIGIQRLIILYGRNQLKELCKSPGILKESQLPEFTRMIEKYLIGATKIQQAERALDKTETCLSKLNDTQSVDQEDMQFLIQELQSKRQFKVDAHPQYLVLEYAANLSIRKDQIEKLDFYTKEGDLQAILQMIMGSGKTAVYTRLIALLFADGKHLSMIMMPEALSTAMGEDLREMQGEDFEQLVNPFHFSRESDYSPARLQNVKNTLLHIIENRETISTDPKSILCFYLKFKEIWRSMRTSEQNKMSSEKFIELKAQFALMRDILNIFRKKTKLLVDEIDSVFNCRVEVNFPIGELSTMAERDMDLLFELHECFSSEEIQKLVKCEFKKDHKFPNAPPFTVEKYHQTVKPALAKHILNVLKNKDFGDLEKTANINRFFSNDKNPTLLKAYLTRDENLLEKAEDYFDTIMDRDVANILVLAQEELNTLLPLCLQKSCDESFGLDKNLFAIPFDSGKATTGTRFSDPHETGSYTLEAYLYKGGIPEKLVDQQIMTLQQQALNEMDSHNSAFPPHLKDTKAYEVFKNLIGDLENISLFKIDSYNLSLITKKVNSNPNQQKFFFKKYILPTITFQTRKLNANSQTLASMFFKIFGFSGTTWNSQTYPDKLTTIPESGTDASTLFALLGKAKTDESTLEVSFNKPQEFISQLPLEKNELALIDSGSYLRGDRLRNLATHLLERLIEKNSPVKGIVFYENDKKVILEAGNSQPIPFSESHLSAEERFTIYPKQFTTGAHIVQNKIATAYVTIGKNLLLRDLLQSVWRMRKLGQGQKIRFIVSDEIKKIINLKLKKNVEEKITTEKIILFAVVNQAAQIGDDNYLSFKQKMGNIIEQEIMDILLDPDANSDDLADLYNDDMEEFFAPSTGKDPVELYGGRERQEPTDEVLKKDTEHFIALSKKILRLSAQKRAKKKIVSFQDKTDKLHETLISRKQSTSNILVQMEIKQEVNVQQEVNRQQQEVQAIATNGNWRSFPWPGTYKDIYFSSFYRDNVICRIANTVSPLTNKIKPIFENKKIDYLTKQTYDLSKYAWRHFIPEFIQNETSVKTQWIQEKVMQVMYTPPWPYSLKNFLNTNEKLGPIASCLSSCLKVSFNFAPNMRLKREDRLAIPFDVNQKPIQYVLIAYNKKTKQSSVIILDQSEASEFRAKIKESLQKNDLSSPELELCLYDLKLNAPIQSGVSNPLETTENLEVQKALLQARLLAGEPLLQKEKESLKKWMDENKIDPNEFKKTYEEVILANHPNPKGAILALGDFFD